MISPNGHYVLIEAEDITETDEVLKKAKEAGIYIQEDELKREQAATTIGKLVAIGPQAWLAFEDGTPWAKVGDKVFYPRHTGNLLKDPDTGKEYVLMSDERVIATYKGEVE